MHLWPFLTPQRCKKLVLIWYVLHDQGCWPVKQNGCDINMRPPFDGELHGWYVIHMTSSATRLMVQQLFQADNKGSIKIDIARRFWGEFTGDWWWISHTLQKARIAWCFHFIMSPRIMNKTITIIMHFMSLGTCFMRFRIYSTYIQV